MDKIRVLIADHTAQVRDSLQALLETEDGIAVVGAARDGREAVSQTEALRPTVVLLDLEMPAMDGVAATIKSSPHSPRVILMTLRDQPWARRRAEQAGADAFVSKAAGLASLVQTIRRVAPIVQRA